MTAINVPLMILFALALIVLVLTIGLAMLRTGAKPLPKMREKRHNRKEEHGI